MTPLKTAVDLLGTYRYTLLDVYTKKYSAYTMRVLVVEQSNLSFKVKFLQAHADGRPVGAITRVQRRKVKLDAIAPQDIINRLPYKDND